MSTSNSVNTTGVNRYRVWCVTENDWVYTWDTVEPTVCPNNNTDTIDPNLTTIVETVSSDVVTAIEDSFGWFETTQVYVNIPSGSPGDVTLHDVTFPMDILLWRTILTPKTDMLNDSITVVGGPETTIGGLTVGANIGDTTLNVNSTVTDNIIRGFLVTIDDGVNKEVLDRCTAIDSVNGTITVETALTNSYLAGTPIKISIYVIKDVVLIDTKSIDIGVKGFRGKPMKAGEVLQIQYTNNSGTAKDFRWRIEYYNDG